MSKMVRDQIQDHIGPEVRKIHMIGNALADRI
jgi:hypothetical protein